MPKIILEPNRVKELKLSNNVNIELKNIHSMIQPQSSLVKKTNEILRPYQALANKINKEILSNNINIELKNIHSTIRPQSSLVEKTNEILRPYQVLVNKINKEILFTNIFFNQIVLSPTIKQLVDNIIKSSEYSLSRNTISKEMRETIDEMRFLPKKLSKNIMKFEDTISKITKLEDNKNTENVEIIMESLGVTLSPETIIDFSNTPDFKDLYQDYPELSENSNDDLYLKYLKKIVIILIFFIIYNCPYFEKIPKIFEALNHLIFIIKLLDKK
ncbi:MAG: hypothetical protein ACRC0S_08010 [Fusobacteriaceae bacterium]